MLVVFMFHVVLTRLEAAQANVNFARTPQAVSPSTDSNRAGKYSQAHVRLQAGQSVPPQRLDSCPWGLFLE